MATRQEDLPVADIYKSQMAFNYICASLLLTPQRVHVSACMCTFVYEINYAVRAAGAPTTAE